MDSHLTILIFPTVILYFYLDFIFINYHVLDNIVRILSICTRIGYFGVPK